MKDSVTIKSNQYGITLILDSEIDFETLVRDICTKFAKNKDFFGECSFVLTIEGRSVTGEEACIIKEAIEINSKISILLIQENQELKDAEMMNRIDRFYYEKAYKNAKIIKRSVKNNEEIASDSSIIILGDVRPKARVKAVGNVIVFGTIEGDVIAGSKGDSKSYIVAEAVKASSVTIGDVSGAVELHKKWFQRKHSSSDSVAIVQWEHELLCEPLRSGILKHI